MMGRTFVQSRSGALALLLTCNHFALPARTPPPPLPEDRAVEVDGQTIPDFAQGMSSSRRAKVLSHLADCTVERFPSYVLESIALSPGSREEHQSHLRMLRNSCLPLNSRAVEIDSGELRSSLFIALYRKNFAGALPQLSGMSVDFSEGRSPPFEQSFAIGIGLRQLADCLVRSRQDDAHAAIVNDPTNKQGSKAIKAAYKNLDSQAGKCLAQQNDIQLDRQIVTGLMAEVSYRQAVTQEAPAGGKN